TQFRHLLTTGLADWLKRVVIDLTTGNDWNHLIEQINKTPRHTCLRLTTLAEKNDVLPRENRIFDLWKHRLFISNDPREQFFALPDLLDEILAHLFFNRKDLISTFTQCTDRAWSSSDGHSVVCYLSWGLVRVMHIRN